VRHKKNRSRELDALISQLGEEHQQAVVDYATFLVQQYKIQDPVKKGFKPETIARPEQETVIAAIKRLKKTYYMLDTDNLLDETSSLMGQHIMHGRTATDVINDLQSLFEEKYAENFKR
jgi:hypothetical protein